MVEGNLIDDLRAAKVALDQQFATFEELGEHLAAVAKAYRERTGAFSEVPREWPEEVKRLIREADDEPGSEFLAELRAIRESK